MFFIFLFFIYNLIFYKIDEINYLDNVLKNSIVLTLIILIIHIVLSMSVGVKSNFSSKQKSERLSNINIEELSKKIEKSTNWKLLNKNSSNLTYKSNFSTMKSFGEIITIDKKEDKFFIVSEPIIFTTIFDFGKNYQNIKLILNYF